jgi:hypothetical protein
VGGFEEELRKELVRETKRRNIEEAEGVLEPGVDTFRIYRD